MIIKQNNLFNCMPYISVNVTLLFLLTVRNNTAKNKTVLYFYFSQSDTLFLFMRSEIIQVKIRDCYTFIFLSVALFIYTQRVRNTDKNNLYFYQCGTLFLLTVSEECQLLQNHHSNEHKSEIEEKQTDHILILQSLTNNVTIVLDKILLSFKMLHLYFKKFSHYVKFALQKILPSPQDYNFIFTFISQKFTMILIAPQNDLIF